MTSAPNITPGPWEACDPGDYGDYDGRSVVILGEDRMVRVAVVLGEGEEAVANARLMASAPDLLRAMIEAREALQLANDNPGGGISDTIWMPHTPETLFDFMDAAIAKVVGEAA